MRSFPMALLSLLLFATIAHADVVDPSQIACNGKKAGDACAGGVCASTFECGNGACRRFADEASCKAEAGCHWSERVSCKPSADKPSSCASAPAAPPVLIALACALRRRRARVS